MNNHTKILILIEAVTIVVLLLLIHRVVRDGEGAGTYTNWTRGMTFIVDDEEGIAPCYIKVDIGFRSDGLVLCRQYNKSSPVQKAVLESSRRCPLINGTRESSE